MQFVCLLPVLLSGLFIAAHFLRSGLWPLVALSVAAMALLLVKKRWAVLLVQAGLILAGIEWLRVLFSLVRFRQAMGVEWHRLAAILGAVAVLTLLSPLVFRFPVLRRGYGLDQQRQPVASEKKAA